MAQANALPVNDVTGLGEEVASAWRRLWRTRGQGPDSAGSGARDNEIKLVSNKNEFGRRSLDL